MPDSSWSHGLWPIRLLCPQSSLGKNTGLGSHSLLHEIFPSRGLNLCFGIAGRFFTIWATREVQTEKVVPWKEYTPRNPLAVQWIGPYACSAKGMGSVPGQGTKIMQLMWHGKKKPENKKTPHSCWHFDLGLLVFRNMSKCIAIVQTIQSLVLCCGLPDKEYNVLSVKGQNRELDR